MQPLAIYQRQMFSLKLSVKKGKITQLIEILMKNIQKVCSLNSLFASRSLLFRAQAFVLAKQHKLFKRDLKPIGLSAQQVLKHIYKQLFFSQLSDSNLRVDVTNQSNVTCIKPLNDSVKNPQNFN